MGGRCTAGDSCTLLDCTLREAAKNGDEVLGQKRLLQEPGDPGAGAAELGGHDLLGVAAHHQDGKRRASLRAGGGMSRLLPSVGIERSSSTAVTLSPSLLHDLQRMTSIRGGDGLKSDLLQYPLGHLAHPFLVVDHEDGAAAPANRSAPPWPWLAGARCRQPMERGPGRRSPRRARCESGSVRGGYGRCP